jgi:hypothetical protein
MVEWLRQYIPRKDIFFDIETIEYGDDFVQKIHRAIPQCRAVLAIIGPHWLNDDGTLPPYVSMELELALTLKIPVIPVLVENTTMPTLEGVSASVAVVKTLNAAQVRSGKDFAHDMEDLSKVVGIRLRRRRDTLFAITGISALLIVIAAVVILGLQGQLPWSPPNTSVAATATAHAENATAAAAANSTTTTVAINQAIATQTAVARAPYTYQTQIPGPCSTTGNWGSDTIPGSAYECRSASAHWVTPVDFNNPQPQPGDYQDGIGFRGATGFTYPVNFSASVDYKNLNSSCVGMALAHASMLGPSSTYTDTVVICDNGQWFTDLTFGADKDASHNARQSGSLATSDTYSIRIDFSSTEVDLVINNQVVFKSADPALQGSGDPTLVLVQAANSINGPPGSSDVANFQIAPLR